MNYSKQQTKLETPAFFTFILHLFTPSRFDEHLFVSLWLDTKDKGRKGEDCQIKSYKRPFDPTAA